jgi:hypothetical protein
MIRVWREYTMGHRQYYEDGGDLRGGGNAAQRMCSAQCVKGVRESSHNTCHGHGCSLSRCHIAQHFVERVDAVGFDDDSLETESHGVSHDRIILVPARHDCFHVRIEVKKRPDGVYPPIAPRT